MTIKTRNRLNISLFVFSLVFLAVNGLLFLFSLYNNTFSLEQYAIVEQSQKGWLLTRYNPLIVLISIYFEIVYVCVTSFMLYRVFEKTQAYDIPFFFLFLIAIIANSLRLWTPLFNMASTYSGVMTFCGDSIIFSKLLVPTSLLFSVVMSGVEQRQDLEKNMFILILGCLFFAQLLPINSTNICQNFEIDYGYRIVIKIAGILVIAATLIALFFNNKQRFYTQRTTIGLAFISAGTYLVFNSTNILRLALSFVFLLVGNILYLKELHKQYLWND